MASKHPSRILDDPPSASPSQVHDDDEEEEEEEEMEVPEEPQLYVEGSEKEEEEEDEEEEEEEDEGSESDHDTTKNLPQKPKLSQKSKNQWSETDGDTTQYSPQNTPQVTKLSQTSKYQSLNENFEEEKDDDDNTTKNSPQNTPQITKLSQTSKNQPLDESSDEEREGSETDDDTTKNSPTASSFIVKPVVNKSTRYIETKQPTTKRALIDVEREKDLPKKKAKVAKDHHSEDAREGSIKRAGRVWSEDDETSILEGMIDFHKKKGIEAHADMGAFLEFVKGRFGFEVTRTQLYEKVRRLKGKFIANLGKGEKFIPTKAHDLKCFKLSKKIWGGNEVADCVDDGDCDVNERIVDDGVDHTENVNIVDGVWVTKKSASKSETSEGERKGKVEKKKKGSDKKNKKTKMVDGPNIVEEPAEPVTKKDFGKDKENAAMDDEKVVNNDENVVEDNRQSIALKYPNLVASLSMYTESQRNLMMNGICLVDSEKARELEDCWKEFHIKESEVYCRKMELLAEQSRLVVDAWKKKW